MKEFSLLQCLSPNRIRTEEKEHLKELNGIFVNREQAQALGLLDMLDSRHMGLRCLLGICLLKKIIYGKIIRQRYVPGIQ